MGEQDEEKDENVNILKIKIKPAPKNKRKSKQLQDMTKKPETINSLNIQKTPPNPEMLC